MTERPGPVAPPADLVVATHAKIAWDKDLAYLPVDSTLVFGADLVRLRASSLWRTYGPTITARFDEELTPIRAQCGIDPLETITAITGSTADAPQRSIVVIHGFSRKLEPCLRNPDKRAYAFLDDTTVVIAKTQDEVDAALKGGRGLPTSPAFVDLWKLVTTSGAGWFVANANAPALTSLKGLAPDAQVLLASIDLTDGIEIDGRLRLGTNASATKLVQALTPQLPAAKALLERLDVTVDGSDIHIVVAATAEQIQGLVAQFASPAVQRDPKGH